jgi:NTE family protein
MASHDIGLVLSGGGGRCFAQIGALRALEEAGYRAVAIAANSSAAILGAIYASGHDARALEAIVRDVDWTTFLDPDGATGLIGHDGVAELLEAHAAATFEALEIPLAVTTVDIETAELLTFRGGPLRPPVCASNAFPALFTPVRYQGRFLMDGGIIDNFPVDVIRTMTQRPVLGIDVRPPARIPLDVEPEAPDSFVGKIAALVGRGVPNAIDMLVRAYNITQSRLVEVTVALHPPDVWLRPDLPQRMGPQDFTRLDATIEDGYRAVHEAIESGRFAALDR